MTRPEPKDGILELLATGEEVERCKQYRLVCCNHARAGVHWHLFKFETLRIDPPALLDLMEGVQPTYQAYTLVYASMGLAPIFPPNLGVALDLLTTAINKTKLAGMTPMGSA